MCPLTAQTIKKLEFQKSKMADGRHLENVNTMDKLQFLVLISYIAAGPTAANPLQRRAAAGWDRRTNGRTPGSCIDPAPRVAMQAMPINRRSDGHNTD